jgi:hypothetical protein
MKITNETPRQADVIAMPDQLDAYCAALTGACLADPLGIFMEKTL